MYEVHRRQVLNECWPALAMVVKGIHVEDIFEPASQPIAGSIPVNRLRRWPNTNASLGLLFTLRKHVAFTHCCFNVYPQSSTLARQCNSIV